VQLGPDNPLGVPPCWVILRATVRLRENPDSLMTALITADSVQILPSLSRAWDLIPWSFLVDWFVPVGQYLDIVDAQAKVLLLDCVYSVYTISVVEYFSDEVLNSLGCSVLSEEDSGGAGYRTFVRLVSKQPPAFGPTRLPVASAPGIPDFGLAGALIWTRIG
jgi:hypothetical protein